MARLKFSIVVSLILSVISFSSFGNVLQLNFKNLSKDVDFFFESARSTTSNTSIESSTEIVRAGQMASNYLKASTADASDPGIIITFIPGSNNKKDATSPCTIQITGNKPYYSCSNSCFCGQASYNSDTTNTSITLTLNYKTSSGSLLPSSSMPTRR